MTTVVAGEDFVRRWYVVRTSQHRERLAKDAIRAAKVEVYLPIERRALRDGSISAAALFPGYVFVRLPRISEDWREVLTAHHVQAVLGGRDRMLFLADLVIEHVRSLEVGGYVELNEAAAVTRVFESKKGRKREMNYEFREGDVVTLRKGVFAGLDALVTKDVRGGRLTVLLELLDKSAALACSITAPVEDIGRAERAAKDVHKPAKKAA